MIIFIKSMTRRSFTKIPHEGLEALGDLGVAINGTGYKKANSMKSQQQKRDRGLSIERGRCYLQELIRCLVKPFVISAGDVDSDILKKT